MAELQGWRRLVGALGSHQCNLSWKFGPGVITGLSLCWSSSLFRRFFSAPSSLAFVPSQKSTLLNASFICKQWKNSLSLDVPLLIFICYLLLQVVKDYLLTYLVVVWMEKRVIPNMMQNLSLYFTGGQMGKNAVSHFRSHWNDTNSPATVDVFRGINLCISQDQCIIHEKQCFTGIVEDLMLLF